MPLADISIVAGRDPATIRALIRQVHTAVQESLDVPPETIRVIVREVPPQHWAVGDVTKAERP
ncbi:tautomerase family protein [Nonomuraea sp. NPDC003707]